MKKKLTLKKEAIVRLENLALDLYKGGGDDAGSYVTCDMMNTICHSMAKCESIFQPEKCQTKAGGGGPRAAGSCGSCGQQTCNGQYSCVPYDCAPTDKGENSCNFPAGCALPSVGCAQ